MRKIFVFGSNLAGRHGKGAAYHAVKHYGAVYGKGEGIQGDSYAIPTKDSNLNTLPLSVIKSHVKTFLNFAVINPNMTFHITPIGCGLAGYSYHEIAPMFKDAPPNCQLSSPFVHYITD